MSLRSGPIKWRLTRGQAACMQQHRTWNNFWLFDSSRTIDLRSLDSNPQKRGCPWRLSNSEMPERVPRALLSASPFDPSFAPSHPPRHAFSRRNKTLEGQPLFHSTRTRQAPCAGLVSNRPPLHACMRRLASSPEPSGLRGALLPFHPS